MKVKVIRIICCTFLVLGIVITFNLLKPLTPQIEKNKSVYASQIKVGNEKIEELTKLLIDKKDKKSIEETLKNFVEKDNEIIYEAFFGSAIRREFDLNYEWEIPQGYDYKKRYRYEGALNEEIYECEAYTDMITGGKMVTIAKTMYSNKRLLGVAGIIIKLK